MKYQTFKLIISGIGKLFSFGKKKIEKTYPGYTLLRSLGLDANGIDLDALYHSTLYDFEHKYPKHSLVVDLFKERTAKPAFKQDLLNNTDNLFLEDLETNMAVLDKYEDIRSAGINIIAEINLFTQIFAGKVHDSRSPHELDVIKKLDSLHGLMVSSFASKESMDLSEHIQEIGKLRDNNQHEAVKLALLKFKDQKWATISDELKYKVGVHLGVTYFELGEEKLGAQCFIELLNYNAKLAEGYSLAALGYGIIDQKENAVLFANKALALDNKSVNAYLALLFSNGEMMDRHQIEMLIPQEVRDNPKIAINIATTLEKKGDLQGAFEIFTKLEHDHPVLDSFHCDILIQLALNRVQSIAQSEDYMFRQLTDESIAKLNYALDRLNIVWDYFKHTSLNQSRSYVIANRGVVYKILGRIDEAERDFKVSLELRKTYFAYRNLIEIYNNKPDELDKIIAATEGIELTSQQKQEILAFKGMQEIESGRVGSTLQELISILPGLNNSHDLNKFYTIVVDLHLKQNNFEGAENYAIELRERNPDDPFSYLLLWRVYQLKGDIASSLPNFEKAVALTTDQTSHATIWEIAEIFMQNAQFKQAAALLRMAANPEVLSAFTQNLIVAEYKGGNLKEAHQLANRLLPDNPYNPFLNDIISGVLEITGKFDEAIGILKAFLVHDPTNVFFMVKLAMNYYKKSEYEKGIEILDGIKDYSKIPLEVRFLIADAYIKGNQERKGLDMGYQLRLENYSDPFVHNQFIKLQTGVHGLTKEDYYPEIVSVDCYVEIVDQTCKRQEYIIVNNPSAQMEIAASEPLARRLLGKRRGETFESGGTMFTVNSIRLKYTYALHDSMNMVGTRFNNEGPFKVLTFESGAGAQEMIRKIFEPVEGMEDRSKTIEELYRSGQTTIGVNAILHGISPIKYWGKLVSTPNLGVYSVGTLDELKRGHNYLAEGKEMIFDITALLTLHYASGFSVLDKLPNSKYVTQSTIDLIADELEEIQLRKDSEDMIVNQIDGQFYRHIVTVEEKRKQMENLTSLLTKTQVMFQIVHPGLPENMSEKEKNDQLLGKSFHETVLVAAAQNFLLISDDVFFRQLTYNDQHVPGLSITGLFTYLSNQNKISNDDIERFYKELVILNYHFVPMSE